MRVLIVPTALALLGACHGSRPLAGCPELDGLNVALAEADARSAFAGGDTRLVALGGFVPERPGAEGLSVAVRYLPGTDDYTSRACGAARPRARRYAKAYNHAMLALLPAKSVR